MDLHASCQAAVALGAAALVPLANLVLAFATILTALVRLAELRRAERGPRHWPRTLGRRRHRPGRCRPGTGTRDGRQRWLAPRRPRYASFL